jgi:hypothetical protein
MNPWIQEDEKNKTISMVKKSDEVACLKSDEVTMIDSDYPKMIDQPI